MENLKRLQQFVELKRYFCPAISVREGAPKLIATINGQDWLLGFVSSEKCPIEKPWFHGPEEDFLVRGFFEGYFSLVEGQSLQRIQQISVREIENFLRDDNTKEVLQDQKLLSDLSILLENVRKRVYTSSVKQSEMPSDFQKIHFSELKLVEKIKLINNLLDQFIRPPLQNDGGDIELISVKGFALTVKYKGACGSCPSSATDTLDFIRRSLKEKLMEDRIEIHIQA